MKKAKAGIRSTAGKRKKTLKTVDEYFAGLPITASERLDKIRSAIRAVVPPGTVEIISYGIPAFKNGKVLVWYAAFAEHCSLFPTASVLKKFKDQLEGFVVSKGTVQFPVDQAVPTALIKKLVKARVAEVRGGE